MVRAVARRFFALVLGFALLSTQSACARAAPEASPAPQAASSDSTAQAGPDAKAIPRKRIIETTLTLDAQEPHRARQQLEQRVAELGGFVETLSVDRSSAEASAHLVMRVPEARLGMLLGFVRALGQVTNETQQALDVTREYVDVDARVRNLQRTEERLLALLAERAGTLADVIAVESELSRVRGESEVLTAQLRAMDHDVAMAKLSVSIHPLHVAMPDDAFGPVRALWSDAGAVLAGSAAVLLAVIVTVVRSLIALLPWSPLLGLIWFGIRRRRLRSR